MNIFFFKKSEDGVAFLLAISFHFKFAFNIPHTKYNNFLLRQKEFPLIGCDGEWLLSAVCNNNFGIHKEKCLLDD